MNLARSLATAIVAGTIVGAASLAHAGDDRGEARADYDAAAAAYDRGDYRIAATRFARADERIPNPRALHLAMAAALRTQEAALGMNLVERATLRAQTTTVDPATMELARKLRARFEAQAVALHLVCSPDVTCRTNVDGEGADPSRTYWVKPGRHVVTFDGGPTPVSSEITVRAGERLDVPMANATSTEKAPPPVAPEPAPAPVVRPSPARASSGLSPGFFWAGVATTGASLVVSTAFMVALGNKHDDFVAAPSRATADEGDAAQTRARVAWALTGVFAVSTVVLAFFTDFGGGERDSDGKHAQERAAKPMPSYTVGIAPTGAALSATFW